MSSVSADRLGYLSLVREVEDFLFEEAGVLDDRRFEHWLTFFADDLRYWMPMRKNLAFRDQERDITGDKDIAWMDDDKPTLTKRVRQILTEVHWAEEPLSRVSHLVSNIRIDRSLRDVADGDEIEVRSNFLLHRNRLETETDILAGRRIDTLRRTAGSFLITKRKIILDQSVLLAKNLTFFF
jgi:3-phenylpropionate/cinnamic acid dioxygenase small subunit